MVCVSCGVVVEENAIVSAVEFVEGAGGASSMVGQFVSATSSKAFTGGAGGGAGGVHRGGTAGRYGFSRDSRETTLANGRRRIQEVASRLRLPPSPFVDVAHRWFTVAVERNFVQGRRTTHVVAACLYLACRQEKSQHMLIDFSDVLQVNVYVLGTTFLKFRRLLNLKLEIIDPALYIYRFAAHLGLDKQANAVAMTALRLVGRMKRDWIVAGRRPAGICAAALLIAARAHGFSRNHTDVTRILKVCGWTVTSRLKEFEHTPSAQLSLEHFHTVDLEQEADPPIFTKNKIREARAKAILNGNVELLTSGALDDPAEKGKKRSALWRNRELRKNPNRDEHAKLYKTLEQELMYVDGAATATTTTSDKAKAVAQGKHTDGNNEKTNGDGKLTTTIDSITTTTTTSTFPSTLALHDGNTDMALAVTGETAWKHMYPRNRNGRAIVLPDHCTAEELQVSYAPTEQKISLEEWKQDMPASMDEELDSFFRTPEEEQQKELIFNKLNKDYLEQQERKEQDRQLAAAASSAKEKEANTQAEHHARYKKQNNKSGDNKDGHGDDDDDDDEDRPLTTEEQLKAAMAGRKVSRKINYDAMSFIFDETGSFATGTQTTRGADDAEEDATIMEEDPLFEMM
jgi:transcription factor IIIB subunit 2